MQILVDNKGHSIKFSKESRGDLQLALRFVDKVADGIGINQ